MPEPLLHNAVLTSDVGTRTHLCCLAFHQPGEPAHAEHARKDSTTSVPRTLSYRSLSRQGTSTTDILDAGGERNMARSALRAKHQREMHLKSALLTSSSADSVLGEDDSSLNMPQVELQHANSSGSTDSMRVLCLATQQSCTSALCTALVQLYRTYVQPLSDDGTARQCLPPVPLKAALHALVFDARPPLPQLLQVVPLFTADMLIPPQPAALRVLRHAVLPDLPATQRRSSMAAVTAAAAAATSGGSSEAPRADTAVPDQHSGIQDLCKWPDGPALPALDPVYLSTLAGCLDITALDAVLAALLLEQHVLLVSHHTWRLGAVGEALRGLLWPYAWHHVYIPLLPEDLALTAQAPVPALVGLLPHMLQSDDVLPALDFAIVVWLDENVVEGPSMSTSDSDDEAHAGSVRGNCRRLPASLGKSLANMWASLSPGPHSVVVMDSCTALAAGYIRRPTAHPTDPVAVCRAASAASSPGGVMQSGRSEQLLAMCAAKCPGSKLLSAAPHASAAMLVPGMTQFDVDREYLELLCEHRRHSSSRTDQHQPNPQQSAAVAGVAAPQQPGVAGRAAAGSPSRERANASSNAAELRMPAAMLPPPVPASPVKSAARHMIAPAPASACSSAAYPRAAAWAAQVRLALLQTMLCLTIGFESFLVLNLQGEQRMRANSTNDVRMPSPDRGLGQGQESAEASFDRLSFAAAAPEDARVFVKDFTNTQVFQGFLESCLALPACMRDLLLQWPLTPTSEVGEQVFIRNFSALLRSAAELNEFELGAAACLLCHRAVHAARAVTCRAQLAALRAELGPPPPGSGFRLAASSSQLEVSDERDVEEATDAGTGRGTSDSEGGDAKRSFWARKFGRGDRRGKHASASGKPGTASPSASAGAPSTAMQRVRHIQLLLSGTANEHGPPVLKWDAGQWTWLPGSDPHVVAALTLITGLHRTQPKQARMALKSLFSVSTPDFGVRLNEQSFEQRALAQLSAGIGVLPSGPGQAWHDGVGLDTAPMVPPVAESSPASSVYGVEVHSVASSTGAQLRLPRFDPTAPIELSAAVASRASIGRRAPKLAAWLTRPGDAAEGLATAASTPLEFSDDDETGLLSDSGSSSGLSTDQRAASPVHSPDELLGMAESSMAAGPAEPTEPLAAGAAPPPAFAVNAATPAPPPPPHESPEGSASASPRVLIRSFSMPNAKQSPASAGAKLETPAPVRTGAHRDTPPPPSEQAEQSSHTEQADDAALPVQARVNRRGSVSRHPMAVELTALISAGHMDRARTSVRTRLAANAAALARSPRAGLGVLDLEMSSEEREQSPAQLILHTPKPVRNQSAGRGGPLAARSPLASAPTARASVPGFGSEAPQSRARVGMSMEAPPVLRGGPAPDANSDSSRAGSRAAAAPGPSSTAAAVVHMASRASAASEMLQLPAQRLRLGVTVLPSEMGLEPGSPGVPADAVLVKFVSTIEQPAQSLSPAQALAYIRLLQSRIGGLQATLIQREAELAWSRQECRDLAREQQATQQRLAAMQQAELVQDALHGSPASSSFIVSRSPGTLASANKRPLSGTSAAPGDLLQSLARLLHLYLHGPVSCDPAVLQGALQLCSAHGVSPQHGLSSPPSLVAHAVALQAALAASSRAAQLQVRQLRAWLRTVNMRKLAAALAQPAESGGGAAELPSKWQPLLQALSNDALTYTDTLLAKPGDAPTPRQAAVLRQAGSQLVPALAEYSNPVALHEWAGLVYHVLQGSSARTPVAARAGAVAAGAGTQSSRSTGGASIASSQHIPAAVARGAALLENIAAQRVQLEVLQQAVVLLHVQLAALESAAQEEPEIEE